MNGRRWFRGAALALPLLMGLLGIGVFLWPARVPSFEAVRAAYQPSEAYLLDRHGEAIDSEQLGDGVRRLAWVSLDQMLPTLVTTLIDEQDPQFAQRPGASPITRQLAMMMQGQGSLHGWRAKGAILQQVRIARALGAHWSRPQIIEAYLNLATYHRELQGIGALSSTLVGKSPAALSSAENLVLATLLSGPVASHKQVAASACAEASARALPVSCAAIVTTTAALLAPPPNLSSEEHLAPQLARAMLHAPGERVMTTLDAPTQRLTRDALSAQIDKLAGHNVRDGALLVVDNATGEVLAYVGSAGPRSRSMEVDGVRSLRLAGSTLKPFLYELALERGELTAATVLDNAPVTLNSVNEGAIPLVHDDGVRGPVSVRSALARSLNVSAVRTLMLVGVDPFRDRLRSLGYGDIRQEDEYYGYSLGLGWARVSLWQQAQAYRTLAQGGRFSPLTLQPGAHPLPADVLDPGAAFIVGDVLADRAARAVTFGPDAHQPINAWSVAKTGTSQDLRDNWCVGFSRRYTVAVWLGNFEGDSMHEVTGVTAAAPVWRTVMSGLNQGDDTKAPTPPQGVVAARTRFSPRVEPARREWYLSATPLPPQQIESEWPPIDSEPIDGVLAQDPDIEPEFQPSPASVQQAEEGPMLRLR